MAQRDQGHERRCGAHDHGHLLPACGLPRAAELGCATNFACSVHVYLLPADKKLWCELGRFSLSLLGLCAVLTTVLRLPSRAPCHDHHYSLQLAESCNMFPAVLNGVRFYSDKKQLYAEWAAWRFHVLSRRMTDLVDKARPFPSL